MSQRENVLPGMKSWRGSVRKGTGRRQGQRAKPMNPKRRNIKKWASLSPFSTGDVGTAGKRFKNSRRAR
ncbi:hypothetical protein A3L08_01070 [Thermococcus pacificus]|uniref:Uncharacterized protein n=1 Tax=Thermococcus pacificus TaxID=71998 RepID=A0A218P5J1_9EURY|nr:hypothetical protein A3L08_01070 [Thermococcus pacificus]